MKKIVIPLILLSVFGLSAVFCIDFVENINKEADSTQSTVSFIFTVKSYEGRVAVFDYGSSLPSCILECPVSSLPKDEAEKLKKGIDICSERELQLLIEAYD